MNVRNGYSPEATTLCRLRLDNDEREYKFTQAVIAEAVRNREDREERIIMLAGRLEDFMKVNAPDLGANVWGDLLESAIESVDFYTLAALYLDDCVRLRTSDVTRQKPQKRPDVCPALFVLLECP